MTEAKRDGNSVTALLGTSNADGVTVLPVYVDSSTNRMLVNATITGTVTVTGAGGASMVDDAAFAIATDTFTPVGGIFDDVSPDSINEGDGGVVRMSANRNLYVTLRDSAGNERGMVIDANGFPTVNINGTVTVGSHAVTNAGTFVVQENGAALTALQLLDDVVATDDAAVTPATQKLAMIGFVFDDTTPDTVNEGDAGYARMSANRNLYVTLRDAAGNERGLNIDASGFATVNINGTVTVGSHAVTNAGTFVVQENGAALTALQLIDNTIFVDDAAFTPASSSVSMIGFMVDDTATDSVNEGDAGAPRMSADRIIYVQGALAHDAVDANNPIKVGARALATPSTATMVANADRTDNVSDLDGFQLVREGYTLGDLISERITNTDGASTASTNFGATASTRNYITVISLFNSSATAGYVDFRDGTAGSILWTVAIPAGGGAIVANGGSPLFRTTANTALAYDVSAALTTVYISVTGFKSKV